MELEVTGSNLPSVDAFSFMSLDGSVVTAVAVDLELPDSNPAPVSLHFCFFDPTLSGVFSVYDR